MRILKYWLLLAVLFALMSLTGCGGGGGGGGSASNTVRGIVRDSLDSDKGVQGVPVTIGGVTAVTRTRDNADVSHPVGFFEMQNVPTGSATALVQLSSTNSQTIAFTPGVTGGVNKDLALFVNIGQVSGQALLPDGKTPASGAYITATATGETVQADSGGYFLISFLPTGSTDVFAVKGTASGTKNAAIGYGVNNIGTLTLKDDSNSNPPNIPYTLTGVITVPDNGTPANTTVILFRNGVQTETAVTDGQGRYYFYVPVGSYAIRARRSGYKDTDSAVFSLIDPTNPVVTNLTMESL